MVDEKVTVRTDGNFTERTVETSSGKSGGGAGMLIGLLILAALGLGVFYLMNMNQQETVRTEAVTDAAKSVSQSVDKAATNVSDAAKDVASDVKEAAK